MTHDPPDENDKVDPGSTDDSISSEAPGANGAPATLDEDQSPFEAPAAITDSTLEEDRRRHAEMLFRLVADHPSSGVLVLQGREADPQTGQERIPTMPFEDSAIVNGIKHIRTQSRRIAGQIVDAADELAEYAPYHHLYAPLAIMDEALPPGRTGLEADIVGVLGLASPTTTSACRSNPTTCWRAGTTFKLGIFSRSRHWSPRPSPWPWACSS